MKKPTLRHERLLWKQGIERVAGIDEAGRGPLAGPVVAAAVILPVRFRHGRLHDSKRLSPELRDEIYTELTARLDICWAVSVADVEEIDRINILRASHQAMRRAVAALGIAAQHALIDGLPVRPFPIEHTALVGGDGRSASIAAASVIAKVTRDRIMLEMETRHPEYGFARHKGYGTALHLARLKEHGPCPLHRRTFLPVAEAQLAFA